MPTNTFSYLRYRPGRSIGFMFSVGSSAANIPNLSPVMGIASVASGGLIGFLTGPALIGFISEKISLGSGLSIVLILSLVAFG